MTRPALAPARVPFPVRPDYDTTPDLRRTDDAAFRLDSAWSRYAAEKLHLLRAFPERVRVLSPSADADGVRVALEAVAAAAADALPGTVVPADDGWRFPRLGVALQRRADAVEARRDEGTRDLATVAADAAQDDVDDADAPSALTSAVLTESTLDHLAGLDPSLRMMDALALALQEDLVLMRSEGDAEAAGHAELLHVCFPSHWDPAARAGASLAELHEPVPHGERLREASPRLQRAMRERGPLERWVWSLHPHAPLDRHPKSPDPAWPEDPRTLPDRLAFRVERQVTLPLPGTGRALFTIRIFSASLRSVLGAEAGRAERLAEAIGGMDDALLAYKRLEGRRELVLDALARVASAQRAEASARG